MPPPPLSSVQAPDPEWDVLIVGAGFSGINAAYHLQRSCPTLRYTLLEMRQRVGGTWDLFRYPGIRSDSDMHTLGYGFKAWTGGKTLADGADIRAYVQEAADENGITARIRFGQKVVRAEWTGGDARWRLTVRDLASGAERVVSARFVYMAAGYYKYDEAHTPAFEGQGDFAGRILHPQFWPEGEVLAGQRVVVIGSGATAITLVPALARTAAHVTMLQRSPSYIASRPGHDPKARWAQRWLAPLTAHRVVRWLDWTRDLVLFKLCRAAPRIAKRLLLGDVQRLLRGVPGDSGDMRHFTPRYNPWDQRVCLVPDGDLFQCLRAGKASVVTGEIARFNRHGIVLQSGQQVEADAVVTATGLALELVGGMPLVVDGQAVDLSQSLVYKGVMYSGVPNLVVALGYNNASFTLKTELTSRFACRVLRRMVDSGATQAVAVPRPGDVATEGWLDFSSGYIQRALHRFPRQGRRDPWRQHQNYARDWLLLRWGRLEDGVLRFGR